MNNSFFKKTKRLLSGVIVAAMAAAMLPVIPVMAEDTAERYPYTMFAGSSEDGAITVNAGNFCVNGNVATNGTISASGNMNINGAKKEKANEEMIYIIDKIDTQYFSDSNVDEHKEDYTLEEMNININRPTEIIGEATLTGNININTALKALEDVNLNGEVKNTNNSVIFSKYGDIVIDSLNVNLNGLIYAPFGNVEITAQNLNLNNVVIIADSITFNCPSVNANYSGNAANFVGTVSEPLNIPYEEWQYMKDENENEFPDFFEDMNNWSKLVDTDGDKLPDCIEQYIGSNPEIIDTDADGIDDYYEVFILGTDPAKPDSDDNGILDSNEDFDSDGLINIQEYYNGTEPYNKDTDNDGLSDGDEVNIYGTDPLKTDTDDDGLDDGDEIYFECDPLNPNSDGNGVLDGYEKRFQTFAHIVENEDCAVKEVIVSMEGTGNLQTNTTIESVMNKDVICSEVVGLIGDPFSIETTSQFEKATLTYVIDKSKLGNTEFDNLLFLWYDEENDEFVELDTVLDEENSTVSVETTHFSKYMLVDKVEWFNAWKKASLYFEDTYEPLATVICYDCSGSMSSNDRTFNYNIYNEDGTIAYAYPTCYRKLAIDNYIDSMTLTDKTALISYESSAKLVSGFSNDKDMLKSAVKPYNSGGTNAQAAVKIAIDELESVEHWYTRHIILLSDGDVNISEEYIQKAQDNKIKIHTIGLGYGASNSRLKSYAESTGGQFFAAATAEELEAIYNDLSRDNHFDLQNMEDLDEDGLPDEFEVSGLVLSNANIIYTDPENPDCDGDGLLDGEEISIENPKFVIKKDSTGGHAEYSSLVFRYNSNPWNKDTDGDGLDDDSDFDPIHSATEEQLKILEFFDSAELFEIQYLAQFCERFECSPIIAIDYINVYRKHADYAIDEVIEDLASLGYKCNKAAFQIYYAEYFNYRDETSWSQIMSIGYKSWTQSFQFFLSTWVLENAFQVKSAKAVNSYELSKKQQAALDDIYKTSQKGDIVKIESAEKVNNEFKTNSNYKPPYQPGTKTITVKLKENKKFVRVYRESGKLTGGWVMEAEQIEGLTPSQIKNKFALEYEPKYICDVEIPAGSTVRYGIANKIINWGNGGGTQYDLMGQFIGEFTNERLL